MTADLVRILGREYVGIEAVADIAFTLIAKTGEVSEWFIIESRLRLC